MRYLFAYIIFFMLFSFSCRKKIAEDYIYYQPYKRDTSSVKDSISPKLALDSVSTAKNRAEEFNPADLNNKYLIVVASFSVEEYALTMKNELIAQGFKPEIFMLNNDGWHKLAISSYTNFEEATEAMARIKQKGGHFSDARIVIK